MILSRLVAVFGHVQLRKNTKLIKLPPYAPHFDKLINSNITFHKNVKRFKVSKSNNFLTVLSILPSIYAMSPVGRRAFCADFCMISVQNTFAQVVQLCWRLFCPFLFLNLVKNRIRRKFHSIFKWPSLKHTSSKNERLNLYTAKEYSTDNRTGENILKSKSLLSSQALQMLGLNHTNH